MRDLIEYIAKSIASYPDDVNVTEEEDGEGRVILSLEVSQDDKGKVIGRHGRVAQSMRSLLRVASVKKGQRTVLDIV